MELTKSFFRKRKTKIFIIIFSVVLLGIIFIYSFSKYYDKLLNDYMQTNSYISFVSQTDYTKEILNMDSVREVKKGILVSPDYSYKALSKNYTVDETAPQEKATTDSFEDSKVYWDLFLLNDECTDIYLASDYGYKLKEGELIIFFPYNVLNDSQLNTLKKLKNKHLGFNTLDQNSIELKIKKVIDFPTATFLVSDSDYNRLKNDTTIYSYRINTTDYKLLNQTRKELLDLERSEDFGVLNRAYASDESYRQQLVFLVDFLKIGSYIGIFLILIVFIIICNDILKEERKNIYVERLVGYNKLQVCKSLLVNILLLLLLSVIVAMILSTITLFILNILFNMSISIFDLSIFSKVLFTILIIFILELIIFSFQISKCLKQDYMKF